MDIQITTVKKEGIERLLQVSVPVDLVRAAEDRTAQRYASNIRVPGFRPGKTPPAIVRKKFGDAIRQEALETIVQEAYKEVLEREQLTPAGRPEVKGLSFKEGEPLTFELKLELRPDVNLARTQGFKVSRPAAQVAESEVSEQVEHLREQRAAWSPVTEGKPSPGDMVTVGLATSATAEMGAPEEYRITLGGGQAIPGIEELLLDTGLGETHERVVKWPDDFPDETQRGQSKRVQVEMRDIKRKSLPTADDAFAREVGDFDSMDALTQAVRDDLLKHAERASDADVRQHLIDEIIAANPFDVPPSWVTQLVGAHADMYQIPAEERDRFATEFRSVAERQIRRDVVIDTIAGREKLKATEADIDARVAEVAQKRGSEPGQVYASLEKAGRLQEIERSITEEKVFQWLLERNTVE